MSNFVFVLDTQKRSLNLIRPGRARKLLTTGKAAVFKRYPFTIILKVEVTATPTGIALVQGEKVLWGAELTHRGQAIKASLESRRSIRRGRRNRHTRYRPARFLNRTRPKGWLAPSLNHRVETTLTWVKKLIKLAPINKIVQELVRFDLQQLENPEISGFEYQHLGLSINKALCLVTKSASISLTNGIESVLIVALKMCHYKLSIFIPKLRAVLTGYLIFAWLVKSAISRKELKILSSS